MCYDSHDAYAYFAHASEFLETISNPSLHLGYFNLY